MGERPYPIKGNAPDISSEHKSKARYYYP